MRAFRGPHLRPPSFVSSPRLARTAPQTMGDGTSVPSPEVGLGLGWCIRAIPRQRSGGCVLSLMGFVGWGALDGIDYMAWVSAKPGTGLDETTMVSFLEKALSSPGLMIPVLAVFTLLPIGLVVLAVGLMRAHVVPAWTAWLMPIGIIGIAGSLQYTVLLVLSALALLASFGYVGLRLLRTPDEAVAVVAPA